LGTEIPLLTECVVLASVLTESFALEHPKTVEDKRNIAISNNKDKDKFPDKAETFSSKAEVTLQELDRSKDSLKSKLGEQFAKFAFDPAAGDGDEDECQRFFMCWCNFIADFDRAVADLKREEDDAERVRAAFFVPEYSYRLNILWWNICTDCNLFVPEYSYRLNILYWNVCTD
jgi:hypothetical protein